MTASTHARQGSEAPLNSPVSAGAPSELFAPVANELASVEASIAAISDVEHSVLQQLLRLTLGSSGKRLRPALVLLSAGFASSPLSRRVQLATAAELLHTATLVHDDIIDAADSRRGRVTANAAFGNTLAVLTGDYLFAKAAELVSGLNSPSIMGVFAWAVMELCQGEMLQPVLDGDLSVTEEQYYAKICSKTASLLAMSCRTGAMLDADDGERVHLLHQFGIELGMAFQIVDDILDITSSEARLGKPVGSDLRQGTLTLPSIYFLQERDTTAHAVVRGLLGRDEAFAQRIDSALDGIRRSTAIARAHQRARAYSDSARSLLAQLPDNSCRRALERLALFVVERES